MLDFTCSVGSLPRPSLAKVIRFVLCLSVGLAIVLAGCGATTVPGAQPTAQVIYRTPAPSAVTAVALPSSAPSATPAPSLPLTQEELRTIAAKAYLAAVAGPNRAYKTLYKAFQKTTSLAAARKYCGALAAVDHKALLALNAITWPTDTAGDAKSLMRNDAAQQADERSCSVSRTWADWNKFDGLALKANIRAHEAANLVRLDLGLPSVGG